MPEKLKIFKDLANENSTDAVTTVPIVTTTETSQAVLKNIKFSTTDPVYPVTAKITQGNQVHSEQSALKNETASDELAGNQIVDTESSVNLVIDTGPDINYFPKFKAMLFDVSYGMKLIKDSYSENIMPGTERTYEDIKSHFSTTTVDTASVPAYSSFGFYIGDIPHYARVQNNRVYVYEEDGTLLRTTDEFSAPTYGVCTDGVYLYGVRDAGALTAVERIRIDDGTRISDLTTNQAIAGQAANTGAYFLHYDGHLYLKANGGTTVVYKINTNTGETTYIAVLGTGSYNAGAVVSVALDGTPYILECGQSSNDIGALNLSDNSYETINHVSLGVSTEYGNLAMEIGPGIVVFFYNSYFIWVDINSRTATTSSKITSTTVGLPVINSNGAASSIANLPLHVQLDKQPVIPRDIEYSLYADGVTIQGV